MSNLNVGRLLVAVCVYSVKDRLNHNFKPQHVVSFCIVLVGWTFQPFVFYYSSGSQSGRYQPPGVNRTIQGVDKQSRGRMGVNEWPGGQWITAGVYWSNEASNSKLFLIGKGIQTAFCGKGNTNNRKGIQTKLRGLIKSQLQKFKSTFDSNSFLLNHPLWWHYENCSVYYVTNNIVVHASQFGSLLDLFWFDTYFPSISNFWTRPRGLQKSEYFNWGSTCRKVWEPLY